MIQKHASNWAAERATEKVESGEAAEKRLRAALAAKRDPTATQSEVEVALLPSDFETTKQDTTQDSVMEDVRILEHSDQSIESQVYF